MIKMGGKTKSLLLSSFLLAFIAVMVHCNENEENQNCNVEAEFTCKANNKCIPLKWLCDGDPDCSDGEDEGAPHNSTVSCDRPLEECNDDQFQGGVSTNIGNVTKMTTVEIEVMKVNTVPTTLVENKSLPATMADASARFSDVMVATTVLT